jgi:GST-like protein
VGKHPLQLYSLATPNGVKVTVMLEELLALGHTGAEYDAWLIRINDGEQFGSGFVAVNPNSKIPALMDRSGPQPVRVFESGRDPDVPGREVRRLPAHRGPRAPSACRGCSGRWAARRTWAAASATSTPTRRSRSSTPIDRFAMEVKRQLDVLDRRLADHEYLAGDEYTIADIAVWPWYGGAGEGADLRRGRVPAGAGVQARPALDRRDRRSARRCSAAHGQPHLGRAGQPAARAPRRQRLRHEDSIADITAVVAVDFARVVKARITEAHPHLMRWRAAMAERPSMSL